MTTTNHKLLTIRAVSDALGVTIPTIYREIHAGRLDTLKIGRRRLVSPRALEQYIREQEQATRSGSAA